MKTLKELKQFKKDFPNNLCDNTGCEGKPKDIKSVKMRKEFGGGWFYWCENCRRRDKDMIEK